MAEGHRPNAAVAGCGQPRQRGSVLDLRAQPAQRRGAMVARRPVRGRGRLLVVVPWSRLQVLSTARPLGRAAAGAPRRRADHLWDSPPVTSARPPARARARSARPAARRPGAPRSRPGRAPCRPSARGRTASRPRARQQAEDRVDRADRLRDEDVEARDLQRVDDRLGDVLGVDVLDAARLTAGPAASSVLTMPGMTQETSTLVSRSSPRTASLKPTTKCFVPQ